MRNLPGTQRVPPPLPGLPTLASHGGLWFHWFPPQGHPKGGLAGGAAPRCGKHLSVWAKWGLMDICAEQSEKHSSTGSHGDALHQALFHRLYVYELIFSPQQVCEVGLLFCPHFTEERERGLRSLALSGRSEM